AGITTDRVQGLTDSLKANLVAELAIVSVSRQAGDRRYEAVIQAQERVYKRLAEKKLKETRSPDPSLLARAQFLTGKFADGGAGINLMTTNYGFGADGSLPAVNTAAPGNEEQGGRVNDTYATLMNNVANAVTRHLGIYGRGITLIRD